MVSPYLNRRPRSEIEVLAAQLDHINQKIDLRYDQLHAEIVDAINEVRRLAQRVDDLEKAVRRAG